VTAIDRFDDLIDDYLLDPTADAGELLSRLRADPAHRRDFVRRMLFESELMMAVGTRPAASVVPTRPPTAAVRYFALAALLLLSVGLGWWLARWWEPTAAVPPLPLPVSPYRLHEGVVLVDGEAGPLREGAELEVVGRQPARLGLPDGSSADLQPGTLCRLGRGTDGQRQVVELLQGGGSFRVVNGERDFVVRTRTGMVTVLGTEFRVSYCGARTRAMMVAVTAGRVRVDHPGGSSLLTTGDQQVFSQGNLMRRVVRGLLVQVEDDGELVVATGRGCLHRTYPLAEDGAVWQADRQLMASTLEPGMLIELLFDGPKVRTVRVMRPSLTATILAVDQSRRRLVVVENDGHSPPEEYPLAESAVLRRGKTVIQLDELHLGMEVRLSLVQDWSCIERLEVLRAAGEDP
jgi:hypothetical protein